MGTRLCKTVVFISAIAFIPMATISHAEETGQCKNWVASVAAVVGKVDAKRHGQQEWIPVLRNNTYCAGDQIRADKASKATLVFTNETLVTLDEHTAITINQVENDGPSILELVKGIAHFISRVPRSLKVNTPFVNAAIEGTEFVVEVGDNETNVTVFEGTVLTANEQGELRVTNNETSKTLKGEAPQKILMARPRDAVQWAIYFPPVVKGEQHDEQTTKSKAHVAITAIVNNQDNALALAKEAVELSPDAAANHIALSYAWQSKFDLPKAIDSAKTATEKEPDNAIAWARLAEMQLSVGELSTAQDSAKKASELDADNARAKTILGYAYLTQIKISNARETFNKAIELDQNDPLPHLGLGLAMIRKNELTAGRREIEIAAALDPNNSIIRSYLGKAYYEEKRGPLDATQFAMAKELDPNDPTPYFYDAIRKQTENDPVGALKDINKSIELNDNRAVYRSSLQLDQDEAARSASLAKVYQELGFGERAVNEASKSLTNDPTNHSAHRFLADAYDNRQRHEIARASEILQAQLFQPIAITQSQVTGVESGLNILSGLGPTQAGASEYNSLFNREGVRAYLDLIVGNNNTIGDTISASGITGNTLMSFTQYYYKTDGFRDNNDVKHNIYDFFIQSQLTNNFSVQAEFRDRESETGDLDLRFDPTAFFPNERNTTDTETSRVGFRYNPAVNHDLIGSFIYSDNRETYYDSFISPGPPFDILTETENKLIEKSTTSEIQYIYKSDTVKFQLGASYVDLNRDDFLINTQSLLPPFPPTPSPDSSAENIDTKHITGYVYTYLIPTKNLDITLGISYDDYTRRAIKQDKINPKLGIKYTLNNNTILRGAVFTTVKRPISSNRTIEPTNVSAFNQLYDDTNGTEAEYAGFAVEHSISDNLNTGLELAWRFLDGPIYNNTTNTIATDDLEEQSHVFFLNWILNREFVVSLKYKYDLFENPGNNLLLTPTKLKTRAIPISLNYILPNQMTSSLIATHIDQDFLDSSNTSKSDDFMLYDAFLSYRLPKRSGQFSIGIKNILDEKFNYYNLIYTGKSLEPEFYPVRTIFARINLIL